MRSVVSLTLALFVLAACSGDPLTAVPSTGAAFAKGGKAEAGTPFKSECALSATIVQFTGTGFIQHVTGVCQDSHMGRSSLSATDVVQFAGTYETQAVLTAANGDELHLTITGSATTTPTGAMLDGGATVTGGTGRFADASGELAQSAVVTFTGPLNATASYHLDGRLAY